MPPPAAARRRPAHKRARAEPAAGTPGGVTPKFVPKNSIHSRAQKSRRTEQSSGSAAGVTAPPTDSATTTGSKKRTAGASQPPSMDKAERRAASSVAPPDMVGDVSFRRATTDKVMTNRQKCLVIGSRSMSSRDRHLLTDLSCIMPHTRTHSKLSSRTDIGGQLREICQLHQCNSCLFIEGRKKETAFLWLAQAPNGPSMKLSLLNVHTADELRMAGNCLKFSRPLLHFDQEFDLVPHLRVAKALLQATFNVPRYHPKSKPFVDHIISCFYLDGKIWLRHYQIVDSTTPRSLLEIGPRFVMEPLVLLDGICQGAVLWKNPDAVAPSAMRRTRKLAALEKLRENERVHALSQKHKRLLPAPEKDPLDDTFA